MQYGQPWYGQYGQRREPEAEIRPPPRKSMRQKLYEARLTALQLVDAARRFFEPADQRPLRDPREYPLGFYLADVLPGATVEVISRPQIVLQGERLFIPFDVARYFDICDIKVGVDGQLAANTALPAEIFAEHARGMAIDMDTATVAQDITILVRNRSRRKRTFMATIIGSAAL